MGTTRPLAALLGLLLLLPGSASAEDDLEKVLKSGTLEERLAAVERIVETAPDDSVELLLLALDDRDGGVAEKACWGLAKLGNAKAAGPLAQMAVTGPVRRQRLAAAAALGAVAPEEGARFVVQGLRAKDQAAVFSAEALAEIRHPSAKDRLKEALRNKEPDVRRAAAEALGSLQDPSLLRDLEPLFADPAIEVRAGAAEAVTRIGSFDALPMLLSRLQDPDLLDFIERRAISGIRRILWTRRSDPDLDRAIRKLVDAYRNEKAAGASARLARVLGSAGRGIPPLPPAMEADAATKEGGSPPEDGAAAGPPPGPEGDGPLGDPLPMVEALGEVGLAHPDRSARQAAAAALARIGGDEALGFLMKTVSGDGDEGVRFHALRGYARWRNARDDAALKVFTNVLTYDKSPRVREEAAVHLGVKGVAGAVEPLAKVLGDSSWEVAVAAAVSLGKTRDPRSVKALEPLLESRDWRLRGGAVAGLGWSRQEAAVPFLVGALGDKEVSVSRTAWEFLKRLSGKPLPFKQRDWAEWWSENGKGFVVPDLEAALRDARKYGYALRDRDVYENLDVLVLVSRSGGDTIQNLLTTLEIEHRLTQAKRVVRDGVQPFGVFVSNCTGEMQPEDHERVQWFVHAGGALFGSCWAIGHTIGKEFPGTFAKYENTRGEVLQVSRAEPMPTESRYLDGVFPGVTRPLYKLWGAHLIEVHDPEMVEVLIDSPEAATRWNGGGNVAAWFTIGHGVVMGSSNHFDRQSIEELKSYKWASIKKASDRRDFAVDHFGFSWEKVRELEGRGVFARQAEAEKEVADLGSFRFLTNFVRRKRIVDL